MTRINFTKLQALGNDFLVLGPAEGFPPDQAPELARRACERHTGVGADGVILLSEEKGRPACWGFRIFNADGSEAELCGNGLRAALACLRHKGLTTADRVVFLTAAGERAGEVRSARGGTYVIQISVAEPRFSAADIPFNDGTTRESIIDFPLALNDGTRSVTCVSVGNPHCCVFVDRIPSVQERHRLGREIETHRFFPERTNVEFIRVLNRREIEVAFWERGVGETLSCGTGACAAAVSSMVKGLADDLVEVRTTLGPLVVEWRQGSGIRQTGPVEVVFEGTYDFLPD